MQRSPYEMVPRWGCWAFFVFSLFLLLGGIYCIVAIPGIFFPIVALTYLSGLMAVSCAAQLWPEKIKLKLTSNEVIDLVRAQFPGPAKFQGARGPRLAFSAFFFLILLSPFEIRSSEIIFHSEIAIEFAVISLFFLAVLILPVALMKMNGWRINDTMILDAEGFTQQDQKNRWAETSAFELVHYSSSNYSVNFYVAGQFRILNCGYFPADRMAAFMNEWRSRALALAQEKAERSKQVLTETASL